MARRKGTRSNPEAALASPTDSATKQHRGTLIELPVGFGRIIHMSRKWAEHALTFFCAAFRQRAVHMRRAGNSEMLRVSQRVNLGEKRFAAVLHCDGERFLVGGGVNSVVMLARLKEHARRENSFAAVLSHFETEQVTVQ